MKANRILSNITIAGIIEQVQISKIRHSRFPLRRAEDNISLEELKISVDERGLLQPIIVRVDDNGYDIVAGNRRLTVCKQLGWRSIMCHILELDDKDAFEVSLIENLQHKSLNAVEEALAYKKYATDYGWGGVSELAKRIGKSHSYVSNRMRLLELPQEILDKIVRRQTSPSIAQEILSVDGEYKQEAIMNQILQNNLSRNEVRKIIHNDDKIEDDYDFMYNAHVLSQRERNIYAREKIILRFIATLRIALMRLDETIDNVDESDWLLRGDLMYHRVMLHKQIDDLIVLKKKIIKSHM